MFKQCETYGCPARVPYGQSHCPLHAEVEKQKLVRRLGGRYAGRTELQQAFYKSTWWRRIRQAILNAEPVCRACGKVFATEVDHIDGDWHNSHPDNLQPLCKPCHSRKTSAEDRRGLAKNWSVKKRRRRKRWGDPDFWVE